jgi:hypothetical protein
MFRSKFLAATAVLFVAGAALFVVPAVVEAGRVGGPLVTEGSAHPDDYDVYTAKFEGGKLARVRVQNAGRADLDIKIIDPATLRVVAQDLRTNADATVTFTPPRTREYVILVHNYSRTMSARYVLFTN